MLTARRLKWVHIFAACERWKEEVIRTVEEIRRLGAWHDFKAKSFEGKAAGTPHSTKWSEKGLKALRHELAAEWRRKCERLPDKIKQVLSPVFELFDPAQENEVD